jgi:hypothetical protein
MASAAASIARSEPIAQRRMDGGMGTKRRDGDVVAVGDDAQIWRRVVISRCVWVAR